ncbi:O-antigen ligase family protein [Pseudoclavibacter terrae]|uniref:O-antigen ligase family protein n=1 Tax=Pseudoclavibacter terrae TaxID=1530195 RepID=UPI00232A828B|nr:O-antigen ligase family protein [Pseudoclavibacter terrae]
MTEKVNDAYARTSVSRAFRSSVLAIGETRIIDAVIMAAFIIRLPVPGLGFLINDLAGLALIGIAAFRKPLRSLAGAYWYPALCAIILAYLGLNALAAGVEQSDINRGARILMMMVMGAFIASGRIDISSALKGFALALLVNVPLFYAGIAPDSYGGLLTGYLGDKNVAGLTYAVVTVLLLLIAERAWVRAAIVLVGGACVVLTDSRTSMAALAAALIWLVLARYLGPFWRMCLAALLYAGFIFAETNLSTAGNYATTREGSDALRERIDAASLEKTLAAPWNGYGLGEAVTKIAGDNWLYHNAYWGLITEGGYFLLIAFLALVALAGFQFLAKGPTSRDARIVEAASIVVLLCAFRLGEVFITQSAFIVIGIGVAIAARRNQAWEQERAAERVAEAVRLGSLMPVAKHTSF